MFESTAAVQLVSLEDLESFDGACSELEDLIANQEHTDLNELISAVSEKLDELESYAR